VTRWATWWSYPPLSASRRRRPPAPPSRALDRQLKAKGLNPFGDPPDTFYAGGTPLFDEKTAIVPREQYVLAEAPDIARACGADAALIARRPSAR